MRYWLAFLFLLFCSTAKSQPAQPTSEVSQYNFDRKYTIQQLQNDFIFLRDTLEHKHPRLYEYTSKSKFDHFLDSLYLHIDHEMTEREFHFFLLPVIGTVHCSHTKLMSSQYLTDHLNDYFKAPPVKAYFTNRKAYISKNFTADKSIKSGAELIAVNGITSTEIRNSFLARMTQEGRNTTFVYNRMNTAVWPKNGLFGFFPGICDYPAIDTYTVSYINPGSKTIATTRLAAIPYPDYPPVVLSASKKKIDFRIADNAIGILSIASFSIPYPQFHSYIDSVFATLKTGKITNLIIDLRGNLGGIPEETVELLTHLLDRPFIYFKEGNGYDDYKTPIDVAHDRYTGKVCFLVDGGCRSSTGHFLAIARYYNIGTMVGEETCGSYSCNDNGRPYTLPNTQLIFQCPGSTYTVATTGIKRGNGIVPNHLVSPTINDIVQGKDTVMKFALHLLR